PSAFATGILAQRATLAHNDPNLTRITNEGTRWQLAQLLARDHLPPPPPPPASQARALLKHHYPPELIQPQLQHARATIAAHIARQPVPASPAVRAAPDSTVDAALRTLRELGPDAAPAVSALVRLAEVDPDYFRDGKVYQVLERIGPAARPAVPLLLRAMRHP